VQNPGASSSDGPDLTPRGETSQADIESEWAAWVVPRHGRFYRPNGTSWKTPGLGQKGAAAGEGGAAAGGPLHRAAGSGATSISSSSTVAPSGVSGGGAAPLGAASVDDWEGAAWGGADPLPANLPTNEDAPPPAAAARPGGAPASAGAATAGRPTASAPFGVWTLTDQPGVDMFGSKPYWGRLSEVFVILFGVGQREMEGIYSLRALSGEGLPQETIIAFESEEDAERYAGLLEATMEHTPAVCSIPPGELLLFCTDAGYACRLEPNGSLLIPPDYNVGVTDWERSLRLREGRWSVLGAEPAGGGGAAAAAAAAAAATAGLSRYADMSGDLDAVRARLEHLLQE